MHRPYDPDYPYSDPHTSGPLSVRLVNIVRHLVAPDAPAGWRSAENEAADEVRAALKATFGEDGCTAAQRKIRDLENTNLMLRSQVVALQKRALMVERVTADAERLRRTLRYVV